MIYEEKYPDFFDKEEVKNFYLKEYIESQNLDFKELNSINNYRKLFPEFLQKYFYQEVFEDTKLPFFKRFICKETLLKTITREVDNIAIKEYDKGNFDETCFDEPIYIGEVHSVGVGAITLDREFGRLILLGSDLMELLFVYSIICSFEEDILSDEVYAILLGNLYLVYKGNMGIEKVFDDVPFIEKDYRHSVILVMNTLKIFDSSLKFVILHEYAHLLRKHEKIGTSIKFVNIGWMNKILNTKSISGNGNKEHEADVYASAMLAALADHLIKNDKVFNSTPGKPVFDLEFLNSVNIGVIAYLSLFNFFEKIDMKITSNKDATFLVYNGAGHPPASWRIFLLKRLWKVAEKKIADKSMFIKRDMILKKTNNYQIQCWCVKLIKNYYKSKE